MEKLVITIIPKITKPVSYGSQTSSLGYECMDRN